MDIRDNKISGEAEVEVTKWKLLRERIMASNHHQAPPNADVDKLLKLIFSDHVLADHPDFVKYFQNVNHGKPMEDRLLREATATAAAYQHHYHQQKLQQLKPHPLVAAVRWVLYLLHRMPGSYRGWRPRVQLYLLLSCPEYSFLAMAIGVLMMAVVLLNTVTFCMESVPTLEGTRTYDTLMIIDYVCLGIFTAEFLLRLMTCNSILHFARNSMNWVDLAAVLPFLVELAVAGPDSQNASKTRIFRMVRLLRVLRLLRASARFRNLQIVVDALASSLDVIFMLAVLLLVLLVVSGTVVYYVENDLVEDSWFDSIPLTIYYMHVTLTTTGYGDYYAKSIWGRLVVGVFMLLCMVTISLPIGVVGGNFSNLWGRYVALRDAIRRSSQAWNTRLKLQGLAAKHCAAVDELITTTNNRKATLEEGSGGTTSGSGGLRALREKLLELQRVLEQLPATEAEDSARQVALQEAIPDLRRRLEKAEARFGLLKATLSLGPRVSSPDVLSSLEGLHAVHQAMATRASEAVRQAARARQQLADLRAMRDVLQAEEAEVFGVNDGDHEGVGASG
ncbi:hypothetical protein VaNZ11_003543 [Volvox africanus]|uniref:Ion transport domain-containing protein n=1 Tax=Volvox africanus TaxID=51714 RepID=A0ABQ5RUH0_9CHLO|nr:hypothetical protein VaNZ11_003543 [Volvox africanus]